MTPTDIDDRDLTPSDPADAASLQHPDPVSCPECGGVATLADGQVCPVCEGSGKATGRTGGG